MKSVESLSEPNSQPILSKPMKLTIEIDDRHTGDLLQFLASLQGKQVEQPEPDDPTQRIVPIPDHMHPLPKLPDGYSQWVGRGSGDDDKWQEPGIDAENRVVNWWKEATKEWRPTSYFSGINLFHIEAIK